MQMVGADLPSYEEAVSVIIMKLSDHLVIDISKKRNIKEEGEEGQKEGISWPKIFEYNALHLCPTMSKLFLVCLLQNVIPFVP